MASGFFEKDWDQADTKERSLRCFKHCKKCTWHRSVGITEEFGEIQSEACVEWSGVQAKLIVDRMENKQELEQDIRVMLLVAEQRGQMIVTCKNKMSE